MFDLSAKEFSKKYYGDDKQKAISDRYFSLDCRSGEGLINPLLLKLKKITDDEFKYYLDFFLEKCINVNRSFSDAIEFLSIWMEKSPSIFFNQLKAGQLKQFFNRTEYDHDGDKWYFPELLDKVSLLVEKEFAPASEVLDYLFKTFDFFNMPEIFVTEVIGYDRLYKCIEECPAVFKQVLLLKMNKFVEQNETIDIGPRSRKYLNDETQLIDDSERVRSELQTEGQKLIAYIQNGGLFTYPSIKNFNPSDSLVTLHRSNYSRGSNY